MAEINTNWQQIERTDYVKEHFWLGEFIQSDKWREPPTLERRVYPYVKDGFKYSGISYTYDNEIHVTEMTHATSFESMRYIINEGGFRSKEQHYPGIGPMNLVWFGLKIGEKEIDCMKENSKLRAQALMQDKPKLKPDSVLSQIARTPAFMPISLYGHFKFTIGIKEVLQAYAAQFCYGSPYPEIRKLGTFAYQQETMHAILVCTPNTPGNYKCPPLFGDPVIQPDAMLETWTWKPHSTGNEYISFLDDDDGEPSSEYIRWEYVSFAFYVPEGRCLKINNLERHVSLCLQRSRRWEISGVNEDIIRMLDLMMSMEVTKRKSLADTLIRMIAGYLKEEGLYEKTMGMLDYSTKGYARVNLELVVQRLRELVTPWEFEALDWDPLTAWMNSLTRHNDVLRVIQKASIRL